MNFLLRLSLAGAALLAFVTSARSELLLASPFTDHMVVQRERPFVVWGTASAGSEVTVTFGAHTGAATADASGRWELSLPPPPGSSQPASLSASTKEETVAVEDVVVGEVWICSGQSNMQMGRGGIPGLENLSEDGIRTLEIKRSVAYEEEESFEGGWQIAAPNSAVAFGFAHHLKQRTEFPVGIILACWGSTSIEAWMPRDMGETLPYFKTLLAEQDADQEAKGRIEAAVDAGKWSGSDDVFMRRHSNIVYNAMIAPLIPYSCRGIVWYQGERNGRYITGMPEEPWFHRVAGIQEYDETLKAWLQRYREGWDSEDFHCLAVMLPGFGQALASGPSQDHNHPTSHSWAWLRESQLSILDLPHTAVANTIDLGDAKNIHPKDKAPIGERLALLAARQTLGQEVVAHGPTFDRMERKGATLVVHFENAEGMTTTDGQAPGEFWIADEQGSEWHRAEASIDGATVTLTHPDIPAPHHVRYAFTGKPAVNLTNAAGLPAYPFRTDRFAP